MDQRSAVFAEHLHLIQSAWRGDSLSHPDNHLYPPAPQLAERIWIATFSVEGAVRASGRARADALAHAAASGRTATLPLDAIQNPIIDAYLAALPAGVAPDPRLAHGLRRRQPAVRAAGRRTRPAPAGAQHRAAGHDIIGDTVTDFLPQLTPTLATRACRRLAGARQRAAAGNRYFVSGALR
jgi:hypothetical protein